MHQTRKFPNPKLGLSFLVVSLLAVLTLLILACGDDETPTATTRPGGAATPTATARPGVTTTTTAGVPVKPRVVVSIPPGNEQGTLSYSFTQVSEKTMPEYDHLLGKDIKTDEIIPEMAKAWTLAPGGKDWTFELRNDIPFYKDGKPYKDYKFSARDLILTWNLLIGEAGDVKTTKTNIPAFWFGNLGAPKNWEVVNDYKVTLHGEKVNLAIDFFLSAEYETGINSRQHWDAVGGEDGYAADPIGAGPWTFVSHNINVDYLHKAVKNHWRKSPEFDELYILFTKESATRLAQLLAKEVDIIPLVRAQRNDVEAKGFKTTVSTLPSVHQGVGIMYFRPESYCPGGKPPEGGFLPCQKRPGYHVDTPLRKPDVRLALNLAVNRNEFNNVFYSGNAFPLVDYFPPWRNDFKDSWAPVPGPKGKIGKEGGWPYPYDPARAKQLLAGAGYPNGFKTLLDCLQTSNVIPEWPEMCEQIIQYFKAVGVDPSLRTSTSFGDFRARTKEYSDDNWMWSASPSLDPICEAVTFSMIWELGNAYREFEEASAFYEKCKVVSGLAELKTISQEFGDIWVKQALSVPLVWVFQEAAYNPEVIKEYSVNMLHMGPVRYQEWTKAVTK